MRGVLLAFAILVSFGAPGLAADVSIPVQPSSQVITTSPQAVVAATDSWIKRCRKSQALSRESLILSELFAELGEITIAYETFGSPSNEAILFIAGVGSQMTAWPLDLMLALAQRGYFVVRFDNRDAGRSTHLSQPPLTEGRRLGAASAWR
jgi:hypothetical protein